MSGQLSRRTSILARALLPMACLGVLVGLAGCNGQDRGDWCDVGPWALRQYGWAETGEIMDQQRARECRLVIRGRRLRDSDRRQFQWADVEVLDVLYGHDRLQTLRGDRIHVAYKLGDDGPPPGQVCTMYLRRSWRWGWLLLGDTAERGVSHVWPGPDVDYSQCVLHLVWNAQVANLPPLEAAHWSGAPIFPPESIISAKELNWLPGPWSASTVRVKRRATINLLAAELTADEMRSVVKVIESRLVPGAIAPNAPRYCLTVQSKGRSYWMGLERPEIDDILHEMIRALPADKADPLWGGPYEAGPESGQVTGSE